jgi:hypothetical protein
MVSSLQDDAVASVVGGLFEPGDPKSRAALTLRQADANACGGRGRRPVARHLITLASLKLRVLWPLSNELLFLATERFISVYVRRGCGCFNGIAPERKRRRAGGLAPFIKSQIRG